MMEDLDPRLNAFRPDLADIRLKGRIKAERFVGATPKRVVAPSAPLRGELRADAPLDSELLRGEAVRVFAETADGWAWVQNETDSYVGYVPSGALGPPEPEPTHRVSALRTFIYPGPEMKLPAIAPLSLGSRVTVAGEAETRGLAFATLVGGEGAVVASHLEPADAPPENDFVAVAERFLHVPYLWGGRTSLGVDCSSLVQLALMTAGHAAPRDTDMQEAALGLAVEGGGEAPLHRGDLIFWKGHVGITIDGEYLLHASGHQMMVVIEPLHAVRERIAGTAGPVTSVRRL